MKVRWPKRPSHGFNIREIHRPRILERCQALLWPAHVELSDGKIVAHAINLDPIQEVPTGTIVGAKNSVCVEEMLGAILLQKAPTLFFSCRRAASLRGPMEVCFKGCAIATVIVAGAPSRTDNTYCRVLDSEGQRTFLRIAVFLNAAGSAADYSLQAAYVRVDTNRLKVKAACAWAQSAYREITPATGCHVRSRWDTWNLSSRGDCTCTKKQECCKGKLPCMG